MFRNKYSAIVLSGLFVLCASPVFAQQEERSVPVPSRRDRGYPPPQGRPRGPFGRLLSRCTPEERQQVKQLARAGRKNELQAFINQLMKKYRPPELKQLDELSEQYRAARTAEEKAAIKQKMTQQFRILFVKRQEFTKQNIENAEKRLIRYQQDLERLKKHYKNGEQHAEQIIAQQVEELCLPPEKRPKPPHPDPMKPAEQPR